MKIVVKIIGILAVLASLLLGSLGASRNFDDAEEVGKYEEKLEKLKADIRAELKETKDGKASEAFEKAVADAKKEAGLKDIPSKSVFENSGMLIALLLVLSLVASVFLFLPRQMVSMVLLGLAVLATLVLIMIAPDMGEKSRATNVQVAWLASLPAIVATLCAFLNARLTKKKSIAS